MSGETRWHQPVMTREVLELLAPRPGATFVDATVGGGGHSLSLLPHLLPSGRVIAVDRDPHALEIAKKRLIEFEPHVTFVHDNYRHLAAGLRALHVPSVDGIVLDLGMSSLQVDTAERGFSFLQDGPLDMRMDPTQEITAAAIVGESSMEELATLFATLGEERFARPIARRIVEARRAQPFTTTMQLAEMIRQAVPPRARYGRLHPATRVFQALRMAVNDELGALEALLADLPGLLAPGGRAVVLTFHSLEDRLVKRAFLAGSAQGLWRILTKKPLRPSEDEVERNPRARSAKVRGVQRRDGR
ncbi:MAG: 16S rRNA (cytosine(1402)-N(4))-methyltransferase RsmH [Candidatus Omnitrophica bacterium]|nr:16S rRNA (cytosine(1402)-N(4))-methyltransferase RsmH [Candidatus Omnitrophota bacterium]